MKSNPPLPMEDDDAFARLMAQVQADEAQRDQASLASPTLQKDVIELIALYNALSERLDTQAATTPSRRAER